MQEESYEHDEEWSIGEIFVLRSVGMFIVSCVIIIIYEVYLDYLLEMFRAGLMDFLVFYEAREYRPTVFMMTNALMILSAIVFFILAWREKNG